MKKLFICCVCIILDISLFGQGRYSVIIDEIMADPSPVVGLPPYEWIEIKNVSSMPVDLQGWRLNNGSTLSGAFASYILQPDSFLVICGNAAYPSMINFGPTLSVSSFPSIDNDGTLLYLLAADGRIIHALRFGSGWYNNELKQEGGWSLEMIDTHDPCTGNKNWSASLKQAGGTPGKKNSLAALNEDLLPPQLLSAYVTDSAAVLLVFDESLDSLSAAALDNYTIDGGAQLSMVIPLSPLYDQVLLKTQQPLISGTIYTIRVNNVSDCMNNRMTEPGSTRTGIPAVPVANEWIINEILFDPRPNAGDYVECYNNSSKILDASGLFIANRNNNDVISSIRPLSTTPRYLFPGDYLLLTEDPGNLTMHYLVKDPSAILAIPSLPSFPDDAGTVVLLNSQRQVTDEVNYNDDWHFALLNNKEGVSLERIDPGKPSQNKNNWHSAAATSGYGTPGYKNSQFNQTESSGEIIELTPAVFSPDNDGIDDIAIIHYKMSEPGYVANIVFFDAAGRPVRQLVRSDLLGINGFWNWDGLNDKQQRLPPGIYIMLTELFNLQGRKQSFKKTIVLAGKLK